MIIRNNPSGWHIASTGTIFGSKDVYQIYLSPVLCSSFTTLLESSFSLFQILSEPSKQIILRDILGISLMVILIDSSKEGSVVLLIELILPPNYNICGVLLSFHNVCGLRPKVIVIMIIAKFNLWNFKNVFATNHQWVDSLILYIF